MNDSFANTLRKLDIPFRMDFGAFGIDDKPLYVRPVQIDRRHFRFDVFIAKEEFRALVPLSSHLMEDDEPGTDMARPAFADWVQACLEPLRRTVPCGVEPDTTFNLFVDRKVTEPDRQALFDVYSGPYLVHGENSARWSHRFAHSLFDWLVANGRIRVPDRPFNLLRLGKQVDAAGAETGLCMVNRRNWPDADATLAALEWPGTGEQQLLNYVVLRRIDVPAAGAK